MYPRILFAALVNFFIPIVRAATNFAECCVRVPVPDDLKLYQWDACHGSYNKSEFHPLRRFSPPILATFDWCRQNCADNGMFQVSDTNQWLSPFSSWVIPAVTMLFLCPISEHLLPSQLKARASWRKWLDELVFNWLDAVIEYIQILGDPASAYNGALTMMMNDLALCMCLKRPVNNERERALITTVMLSEQVDIEAKIVRVTFQILSGLDKAQDYSQTACRTMYAARKKFHMAVTLPVAFYIGIAAAIFYDANQKLGDNDTAHSLAYGILYNWILLLSVYSNCFATHISLEAIRSGLEVVLRGVVENYTWAETENLGWDKSIGPAQPMYEFAAASLLSQDLPSPSSPYPNTAENTRATKYLGSIEVKALPLHERYFNAIKWNKWLFDKGVDVCRPTKGVWKYHPFWLDHWVRPRPVLRYIVCQGLSWLFVVFPCICAALISYTTPKVSFGCRSFNHLLYAFLALVTAALRVPKHFVDPSKRPRLFLFVSTLHNLFIWFNAVVVLVGGTTLQLIGAYRTCWCAAGFFDLGPDSIIPLGVNSFLAQYWAKTLWFNIGYVAFGGVVVAYMCALVVRLYISCTIRDALDI